MTSSVECSGWDRTFLDLSSKLAEPFCNAWHLGRFRLVAPLDPQLFETLASRTQEIAVRALIGLGAAAGAFLLYTMPAVTIGFIIGLEAARKTFRWIGFSLQKEGYTHVRGEAPEKPIDSQVKVMNWNVCGIGGGLSLDHGGVVHWRSRLDAIVAKIRQENPDVLVLQEIYDAALGEALIKKLNKDYAHFYTHLGPNLNGSVSGGMVLSKCPDHHFSFTSYTTNDWTLNRGFSVLELKRNPSDPAPSVRIIGTHLNYKDIDQEIRKTQIDQITAHLATQPHIPTILAGDLNIERDSEGTYLSSFLEHGYRENEPTCTNHLVAKWDLKARGTWGETIDYVSLFKPTQATLSDCHLVRAFDATYNTKTALSDHHGISATLVL